MTTTNEEVTTPATETGVHTNNHNATAPDAQAAPTTAEAQAAADAQAAQASAEEHADEIPHLPDPSIWPFIIALGLACGLTGVVIGLWLVIVGGIIFLIGLVGWIVQDIQVAQRGDHH
jgi:uncharacterized membrane protein